MSNKALKKCTRCGTTNCTCSPSNVTTVRPIRTSKGSSEEELNPKDCISFDEDASTQQDSSFFFTDSIKSVSINPGETTILTLKDIPTSGDQAIKLDFSDRLEIETFPDSFAFGFNITYRIVRINTVACFTLGQDYARTSESNQYYFLTPSLTWTDLPPEGMHTYELKVTLDVNSGSFKSAIIHDRTLNGIIFPSE